MVGNNIIPETEIYSQWQETQKQKGFYNLRSNPKHRANNRKTNRCRKMQSIKFVSKSWPPIFFIKEIKTFK
jgi:hypothetical protein